MTFKAIYHVIKAQHHTIKELKHTSVTRADIVALLNQKADLGDVKKTMGELIHNIEGRVSYEDFTRAMDEHRRTINEMQM
jgi:predicted AAA+ superfamily ATPase